MEFIKFNKIPRLNRDIVITEKIDGTNAQIFITSKEYFDEYKKSGCPEGICSPDFPDRAFEVNDFISNNCIFKKDNIFMFAGSRNRWIQPENDNMGFARWVHENAEELIKLGEGRHFGEWWGGKIQRGYGLKEKRFSLFNVKKWSDEKVRPKCCNVVPVLHEGKFDTNIIENIIYSLKNNGSVASPGFKDPEGIIIYHTASGQLFKKTCVNDEKPKGK